MNVCDKITSLSTFAAINLSMHQNITHTQRGHCFYNQSIGYEYKLFFLLFIVESHANSNTNFSFTKFLKIIPAHASQGLPQCLFQLSLDVTEKGR